MVGRTPAAGSGSGEGIAVGRTAAEVEVRRIDSAGEGTESDRRAVDAGSTAVVRIVVAEGLNRKLVVAGSPVGRRTGAAGSTGVGCSRRAAGGRSRSNLGLTCCVFVGFVLMVIGKTEAKVEVEVDVYVADRMMGSGMTTGWRSHCGGAFQGQRLRRLSGYEFVACLGGIAIFSLCGAQLRGHDLPHLNGRGFFVSSCLVVQLRR